MGRDANRFRMHRAIVGMAGIAVPCIKFIATVDFLPECVSRFRAATSFSSISFYRGNPPPPLAVKRPDIPARTIVLAAIKLRHQKKASSISSNGIDLHTMTGGEGGRGKDAEVSRSCGREFVAMWNTGTPEGGWTKSNSPPGTDDKAPFPKRKIVWPFFRRSFLSSRKLHKVARTG